MPKTRLSFAASHSAQDFALFASSLTGASFFVLPWRLAAFTWFIYGLHMHLLPDFNSARSNVQTAIVQLQYLLNRAKKEAPQGRSGYNNRRAAELFSKTIPTPVPHEPAFDQSSLKVKLTSFANRAPPAR
jgi:hypothetical protein